jgi:hypothetical protein
MLPRRRLLSLSAAVLTLGLCPLMAASITYNITGTLGPIISGSDPLGANGKTGTITIVVSETLKPKKHTATSATYTLPAGAITVNIGGTNYVTSGTSSLQYAIPAAGPDTMVVTATVIVDDIFTGTVVGTASLAKGSFTSAILKHPQAFKPSPQTLTAATTASGRGSKVKYTALGSSTTLGLSGSASD